MLNGINSKIVIHPVEDYSDADDVLDLYDLIKQIVPVAERKLKAKFMPVLIHGAESENCEHNIGIVSLEGVIGFIDPFQEKTPKGCVAQCVKCQKTFPLFDGYSSSNKKLQEGSEFYT